MSKALLDEILKHPADDAPRQVYADHLEQEGEVDRANFIRHQLRRAALPAWELDAVLLDLAERELLAKHAAWRAELPAIEGVTWGGFARGFVDSVELTTLDRFDEQLAQLRAASPVQRLAFVWPRGKPPKLPAIATLRHLTVTGTVMSPDALKWLASCPLLSTLSTLELVDSWLRTGLPHLLKSTHVGRLEVLRIPLHLLGNAGVAKLATARSMPLLRELDLSVGHDEGYSSGRNYSSPPVTSKSVDELAGWEGLARIRTLDLSGAKLGLLGLHNLLASPQLRALKELRIRGIKDGDWDMDDSLAAFKAGPACTLDELDVSDNDLDPEGAHHLGEAKALRELKVLRLVNVRSRSFEQLAKASWVRSLRVLACTAEPLPHFLARAPAQLHTLELAPSSTHLTQVALRLAEHPPPALRVLDLSRLRVDDTGLDALSRLALPTLVSLRLPRAAGTYSQAAVDRLLASKLGHQLVRFEAGLAVDRP